jgi:hypothetical protein
MSEVPDYTAMNQVNNSWRQDGRFGKHDRKSDGFSANVDKCHYTGIKVGFDREYLPFIYTDESTLSCPESDGLSL